MFNMVPDPFWTLAEELAQLTNNRDRDERAGGGNRNRGEALGLGRHLVFGGTGSGAEAADGADESGLSGFCFGASGGYLCVLSH